MTTMNYNKAMEKALRIVNHRIDDADVNIASFIKKASTQSITEAMVWLGENVMTAERIKHKAQALKEFLEKIKTDEDVKNAIERVQAVQEQCLENLTGGSFGVPGRGPWAHNSSGAISNIARLSECDADREILVMYRNILRELAMDDATHDAEQAEANARHKAYADGQKAKTLAENNGKGMKVGQERALGAELISDMASGTHAVEIRRPTGVVKYTLFVTAGVGANLTRTA